MTQDNKNHHGRRVRIASIQAVPTPGVLGSRIALFALLGLVACAPGGDTPDSEFGSSETPMVSQGDLSPTLEGAAFQLSPEQRQQVRALVVSSPEEHIPLADHAWEDSVAGAWSASTSVVDLAGSEPHLIAGRVFYAERWDTEEGRLAEGSNGLLVEDPEKGAVRFRRVVPMRGSPDQVGPEEAKRRALSFAVKEGLVPFDASEVFDVRSNAVASTHEQRGDQGIVFHTVYLRRAMQGLPVYNSSIKVRVAPDGEVLGVYNNNWMMLSDEVQPGVRRGADQLIESIERIIVERSLPTDVVRVSPPQLYWQADGDGLTPVVFAPVTVTRHEGDVPTQVAFTVIEPVLEGSRSDVEPSYEQDITTPSRPDSLAPSL